VEQESIVVLEEKIAPSDNPERESYNFGGWFTDNDTFLNEWNFKTNIVTQDTTLYARWKKNYPKEIPFIKP